MQGNYTKNFTSKELDFFLVLCVKLHECNSDKVALDLHELRSFSQYKRNGLKTFCNFIVNINQKLQLIGSKAVSGDRTVQKIIFYYFDTDYQNDKLTVAVNPEFTLLFRNYTYGDCSEKFIKDFLALRSKYSKNLYRILNQYKKSGVWQVSVDELRNSLGIPSSCTLSNIFPKFITPSIKEIASVSNYKDLSCTTLKKSDSTHRTVGYRFTFTPI